MPVASGKNPLFAKIAGQAGKAHEACKAKPPETGGGQLPDGIENGIARLSGLKLDTYKDGENKGKPYFSAVGVVLAPADHNGIPIKGLQTRIGPESMFDTPNAFGKRKTFADHYEWMLGHIKLLTGVHDMSDTSPADLEGIFEGLVEEAPTFRFRTWKGKKQTTGAYAGREPKVNHDWQGRVEWHDDGDGATDGVQDDSGSTNDAPADEPPADDAGEGDDLAALVAAADGGDEEAGNKLTAIAAELGVADEDVANAKDWSEVKEMIELARENADAAAESQPEPDPEPWKASKGEVAVLTVIDAKTKKKTKVDVKITAVYAKTKTADVERLDTKKAVKGVKLSDLSEPS